MTSASAPIATAAGVVTTDRIRLPTFLIIGSMTTFGPLCTDLYLTSLPVIGRDMHTSTSTVQLSLTACLVGLGLGQGLVGPISDRFGRRRPLFVGVAAFIVASLLCAVSPNVAVLIGFRFVEGLGGAAGAVIARAVVRDLYSGAMAARFFSLLVLITGVSPLLAPQLGALLVHVGSWRLQFVVLGVLGTMLLAAIAFGLPETLPPQRRRPDGVAASVRTMCTVATDRNFLVNALAYALGFGALWTYVAGSSFVLENIYGLSPSEFGFVFALNGIGMVLASQVNGRLVRRVGSTRLLTMGVFGLASAGMAFLVVVVTGTHSLVAVLACLLVLCSANGFIAPNAMALAMEDFPEAAGSAAALVGMCQYSIGAVIAPVAGVAGNYSALPMAISMAGFGAAAFVLRICMTRRLDGATTADV